MDTTRFEIRRTLGEGGMGVVYEAHDTVRDMVVALKTLKIFDANLLYHFKNEFRSHADLHHPNLCTLYELFEVEGSWYFTMELVAGGDFMEWVCKPAFSDADARFAATEPPTPAPSASQSRQAMPVGNAGTLLGHAAASASMPAAFDDDSAFGGGTKATGQHAIPDVIPFDEARLRDALAQLAAGLHALHTAGKVHRDIKPGNILVTPNGRVVIMDFGLVADRTLLEEFATSRMIAGTPMFMAPEQGIPGANVGTPADWYAVGVILYQVLTRRLPFADAATLGELIQMKHTPPPTPTMITSHAPADLADLATRLLHPDPAQRPTGPEVIAILTGKAQPVRASARMAALDVFVGRRAELTVLHTALTDSRREGVAVLVEGASGLGKTALVRRFLDEVGNSGTLILEGRCYSEESLPYKAFDGIVDALTRHLVTMDPLVARDLIPDSARLAAKLFPVMRRIPQLANASGFIQLPTNDSANGVELRTRAFAALIDMFRRVSNRRPLLLFVDDLQWADGDSLLLLRELLDATNMPRLAFVASVRTDAEGAADLSRWLPPTVRRLELAPLQAEDAALLVERILPPGSASAERRHEIAREAAGHPLFLAELAHHLATHDGPMRIASVDDALWERAQALDKEARGLLQVISVAGTPLDAKLAAEAAGLSPTTAAPMIASLRASRFVKTSHGEMVVEPYHDRVRESVVTRMGADKFTATSAELAHVMLRSGMGDTAPEVVVRHLFACGDRVRGCEMAEKAGERFQDMLAFDRAAEFFRMALAAGPRDAAHSRQIHLALADALASGGRGAEAAEAFLAAAGEVDDEAQLDCRRRAADQLLVSGHVGRGLMELKGVLDRLGEESPETAQDALASLGAARAAIDAAPVRLKQRRPNTVSANMSRRLDVYQSSSLGLILVDNVRGADYQARALQLAIEVGDPRRLLRALVMESIYRAQETEAGRLRAVEILGYASRIADGRDDPWMDAYITFGRAFGAYYDGRFRLAVDLFKDAYERFRSFTGVAWEMGNSRVHRLRATDYLGAWGELRGLYDEYLRDAQRRDDRYVAASITRWFNVLWLAHDRPDLAGADLDRSPWAKPKEGEYHLQHFLELRARVELAFYRGDGGQQGFWARPGLEAAERSLLFRIQVARAIRDWLLGRIAACEGNVEEVEMRSQHLADDRVSYGLVWSALLHSTAVFLRGDLSEAIESLLRTAKLSDDNDFPLCAAVARLRAGQLSNDGVMVASAVAWMKAQEIVDPIKMAEVFAPGFTSLQR